MCAHRGESVCGHREKAASVSQGERPQENPNLLHCGRGFPASRTVRNTFLLFKPRRLWYLIMVVLGDESIVN